MAGLNLKDIKEVKKSLVEITKHGFLYFVKNVFLVLIAGVVLYMFLNLEWTIQLFQEHTERAIYTVVIFLLLVYLIARSETPSEKSKKTKEFVQEIDKVQKKKEEENIKNHDEMMKKRLSFGLAISNILKDLIISLDASRVSIIEMHNGTNTLCGIPFIYGDMTYQETDKSANYTIDEFQNFNITKYPFFTKLFFETEWFGSIEEIKDIDKMLYLKMLAHDSKHFGFMTIYGLNGPIAFLLVVFDHDGIPDALKFYNESGIAAQKISTLLDPENIKND